MRKLTTKTGNKFTLEEIRDKVESYDISKYDNRVLSALKGCIGTYFNNHFNGRPRPSLGKGNPIEMMFYLFNTLYIVTATNNPKQGFVVNSTENIDTGTIPLYEFIYNHCNPEGYYFLEKAIMESL